MADQSGPTLFGKPVGGVRAFFQGTDPRYNAVPLREGYQQAAQGFMLPQALWRLSTGFQAPSIAPAAREAQRQFREETVPGLMEQFAGGGSQGALLRGIQGAGSDLQSKLGALQMQQQFELQKQRQEQLPRLAELGLAPSFQPTLTDKPIQDLPELFSSRVAQDPRVQELLSQLGYAGSEAAGTAAQGVEAARRIGKGAGVVGGDIARGFERNIAQPVGRKMQEYTPEMARYIQSVMRRSQLPAGERVSRAPVGGVGSETGRKVAEKYSKKLPTGINPALARKLRPEHEKMIDTILKHRRSAWKQAFKRMTTIPQLEELYGLASGRKPSRSTLNAFLKRLGGK